MTTHVTVPGMTGEEMIALVKKHTLFEWSAQSKVDPLPVAKAKGVYFWTPEGKRFLDFNSQLMSVNIGHGDPRVIEAIHQQASTLAYANPFMATEPRARLGAKLAEITPGDIDTFFFTNGGAESNENAIKIARLFTGRHKILARYRSYHGATVERRHRLARLPIAYQFHQAKQTNRANRPHGGMPGCQFGEQLLQALTHPSCIFD